MRTREEVIRGMAEEAAERFLADRGAAEKPAALRECLPDLIVRAYEVGRRRAYQSMRISLEVAAESVTKCAGECREGEGDQHEAATMEIWP